MDTNEPIVRGRIRNRRGLRCAPRSHASVRARAGEIRPREKPLTPEVALTGSIAPQRATDAANQQGVVRSRHRVRETNQTSDLQAIAPLPSMPVLLPDAWGTAQSGRLAASRHRRGCSRTPNRPHRPRPRSADSRRPTNNPACSRRRASSRAVVAIFTRPSGHSRTKASNSVARSIHILKIAHETVHLRFEATEIDRPSIVRIDQIEVPQFAPLINVRHAGSRQFHRGLCEAVLDAGARQSLDEGEEIGEEAVRSKRLASKCLRRLLIFQVGGRPGRPPLRLAH